MAKKSKPATSGRTSTTKDAKAAKKGTHAKPAKSTKATERTERYQGELDEVREAARRGLADRGVQVPDRIETLDELLHALAGKMIVGDHVAMLEAALDAEQLAEAPNWPNEMLMERTDQVLGELLSYRDFCQQPEITRALQGLVDIDGFLRPEESRPTGREIQAKAVEVSEVLARGEVALSEFRDLVDRRRPSVLRGRRPRHRPNPRASAIDTLKRRKYSARQTAELLGDLPSPGKSSPTGLAKAKLKQEAKNIRDVLGRNRLKIKGKTGRASERKTARSSQD